MCPYFVTTMAIKHLLGQVDSEQETPQRMFTYTDFATVGNVPN
jgi:hypothetical protein